MWAWACLTCLGGHLMATPAWADPAPVLRVWINGDKAYKGLQQVGDQFEARSGVKVVVEHPEDAPAKFQQAAAAGKGPDIFCWPHDRVGEWAKAGLLVPVQPSPAVRAAIDDTAWSAFRYQGRLWGYPLAIETLGLIYNRQLVRQPPADIDGVIQLDRQLAPKGVKALLFEYNKAFFSWGLFAGAGGEVFGTDAKGQPDPRQTGVNTPGAVRAGEALARLIKEGVMPKGARYSEMEARFSQGQVAMMISGPWAWDNARRAGIDIGVAPLPSVIPGQPSRPFVGVLGCMVTAPSKVKDLAREFLERQLLTVEALRLLNADVPLGVPAHKGFYAELSKDPNIRATMENARAGRPVPNIPETGRFWTAMDAAIEAITNGQQSPKDALDGAAARILVK